MFDKIQNELERASSDMIPSTAAKYDHLSPAPTPKNSDDSFDPITCVSETDVEHESQEYDLCDKDLSLDLITYAALCLGPFVQSHVVELSESPVSHPGCTPFDAARVPQINIATYIDRMFQYSQLTPESALASLIILRRLSVRYPEMKLTNFNVHRVFLTSCLVFAKYYDDDIDTNARWARIAGVSLSELNVMEVDLLNRCQFDLRVSTDSFHETVKEVVAFAKSHHCSPCSTPTQVATTASSPEILSRAQSQPNPIGQHRRRKTLSGALHALFHLHLHHDDTHQDEQPRMHKNDRGHSSVSLPEVFTKSTLPKRKQSHREVSSCSTSPNQSPKHFKRIHGPSLTKLHLSSHFVKRPVKPTRVAAT